MVVNVFEVRGVYLFRLDDRSAPELDRYYNETADRYEVPAEDAIAALDVSYQVVEEPDRYRVRFHGDLPVELLRASLHFEEGPGRTTLLLADEALVEEAIAAGGQRVSELD